MFIQTFVRIIRRIVVFHSSTRTCTQNFGAIFSPSFIVFADFLC